MIQAALYLGDFLVWHNLFRLAFRYGSKISPQGRDDGKERIY